MLGVNCVLSTIVDLKVVEYTQLFPFPPLPTPPSLPQGRSPFILDPAMIISITDGGRYMKHGGSLNSNCEIEDEVMLLISSVVAWFCCFAKCCLYVYL